jgi:LmbE family N-acetylglucosaminyl deacetylase
VTVAAVRSLGERAPALFEVVLPGGLMRRLVDRSRAAGASSTAGALWGVSPDAFGLHAEPPEFAVDVRAYVSQKLDALRCHESQLPVGHPLRHLAPREAVDLLGVEYFRRAPQADGAERA